MRQRYGLNYVQISKILSFGPNQYSQYENGQIPSDSDGRILAAVRNKQSMLIFLENARNELGEKEYLALRKSIASSKEDDKDWRIPLFFQGTYKSLNNGYVTPSAEKLEQVVRFFVSREGSVFPTKLNKNFSMQIFFISSIMARVLRAWNIKLPSMALYLPITIPSMIGTVANC